MKNLYLFACQSFTCRSIYCSCNIDISAIPGGQVNNVITFYALLSARLTALQLLGIAGYSARRRALPVGEPERNLLPNLLLQPTRPHPSRALASRRRRCRRIAALRPRSPEATLDRLSRTPTEQSRDLASRYGAWREGSWRMRARIPALLADAVTPEGTPPYPARKENYP